MAVRLSRICGLLGLPWSLSLYFSLLTLLQPLRLLVVSHLHLLALLRLALLELLLAFLASSLLNHSLLLSGLLLFHPLPLLGLLLLLLSLVLLELLTLPILILLRLLHVSLLACIHRRIHAVVFSRLCHGRAIRIAPVRECAV